MKRRIILFTLCVLVVVGSSAVAFQRWSLDGINGALLSCFLSEDTEYAPRYSDSGFRAIRVGMSVAAVESLVGPPESTWTLADRGGRPGEWAARWSYSPHDTNFRLRVLFYRNGRVTAKHSEFYVD